MGEIDASEARAVGVPAVVARGVVRDTTDPTGRTMYVLLDRAMSDAEMRDWHDQINALHPASPLEAVAMRDKAVKMAEYLRDVSGRNQDGDFYVGEEAAMFAGSVADEIVSEILALPLPTDAELLAAAMELPEVRALVDVLTSIKSTWILPSANQLAIEAALAPFARKGE